ncbi:MAG: DUF4239 domain-containing protein [Acidobacteriia bacterium]|nr:DUF4239 domain-containing protein [Terriglobia bacterium]
MNSTPIAGQVLARVALLVASIFCYWLLRGTAFFQLTAGDGEGLNTLILLIGSIYAVMYAFVIYVIWGQFTDVEKFVMRECYTLDDLLRFSHYMDADSTRAIRRSVAEYSQAVLQSEWQALAERGTDLAAEKCFATLMMVVIRIAPANAEQQAIQQRLIDIAREVGEHRDERITKSLTRIPPTLMGFVHAVSVALAALVFVYPFRNPLTGSACFGLIAALLLLANMVMTDLDNPFNGVYNVSSDPFSRLTR